MLMFSQPDQSLSAGSNMPAAAAALFPISSVSTCIELATDRDAVAAGCAELSTVAGAKSSLRLSHLRLKSFSSRDLSINHPSCRDKGRPSKASRFSNHNIAFSGNGESSLRPDRTPNGIFIGVSLGGKSPMVDADNIEAILDVLSAQGYTEVTFLVTDDIARYNYHVFNTCSLTSGAALRDARKEGDGLCTLIESVAQLWSYMDIRVRRWRDISTSELAAMVDILEEVSH
jgi:hypothetical protein